MRRSAVLALCAATLWSCSSSVGWAPGRCVREYDTRGSFREARVLMTKPTGVVVYQYSDPTQGDGGLGFFDPAEPRGRRLAPCPAAPMTFPGFMPADVAGPVNP